ncbi:MAG: AsmA-like C-terminal region-containing protein [Bacteroidota bacterium]
MKKFFLFLGIVFSLLLLAIIILPMVFEDDIRKAVDKTIDESLNATVYYNPDALSLSLIKSFPDITVSIEDFGIVGIEEFSEDTLVSVNKFEVTVDLMSILTGGQIMVEEILLNRPKIFVLILENGKTNYAIAKESDNAKEERAEDDDVSSKENSISIGIERWAIEDGSIIYLDQSTKFYTSLLGLNHEGTGDFTSSEFDIITNTSITSSSLGYEGVEYVSDKRIKADVMLNLNSSEMQYTFKKTKIAINDFAVQIEGFLSVLDEDIDMDITFAGNDINLKSILSLIPGVYQEYLDGLAASGEINLDGLVKGTYNKTSMPKVSAGLSISNGTIAYSEYDIPMEQINIETNFDYPSSDLSETSFNVNKFSMLVDGEKLSAYLKFKNLENYTWDLGINGSVDLEKMTKIMPMEGMTIKGKINADLKSSGQMSVVEAEQYGQLPTSGNLKINGFYFESVDIPQGFGISEANISFNPSEITLSQFNATSGSSDFNLTGNVKNYLGYALKEELLAGSLSLSSDLINLNEFIPESGSEEAESDTDTSSLEVISIPENIDFAFSSSIQKIIFTNLNIKNFYGSVLVKDGTILLNKNSFNMLDGDFELSGSYITKNLVEPKYDFGFKIKDLSIANAFESFSTIQQYIPIAKQVTGKFSTDFNVNGFLGNDMMPITDKINLVGLVNVAQATLSEGEFILKLNTIAAFKSNATSEKNISIKDILIKTEIKDGHLFVEPFDLNVKGQRATLGGSNTLDGKLNYSMLIKEIPTGAIGNTLNSAMSSLTGGKKLISDKIDIDIGIEGTYDNIQIKLLNTSSSGSSGSSSAVAAFKEQMTSKVDQEKEKAEVKLAQEKAKAEEKAKAAADSKRAALESKKKAKQDSINNVIEAQKKKAREAAKNKVKKLFKRGGSNELKT